MEPGFSSMDLFCRINVQAESRFQDIVALIARCAGGSSHENAVRSQTLDISVFENDDYDNEKAHVGEDRWLYFRYRLDIDPIEGVSAKDYVAAIGSLLTALWSAGMDVVAASDFEDQLPRNVRRLNWAKIPRPGNGGVGRSEIIDVTDIVIPAAGDAAGLEACARVARPSTTEQLSATHETGNPQNPKLADHNRDNERS